MEYRREGLGQFSQETALFFPLCSFVRTVRVPFIFFSFETNVFRTYVNVVLLLSFLLVAVIGVVSFCLNLSIVGCLSQCRRKKT